MLKRKTSIRVFWRNAMKAKGVENKSSVIKPVLDTIFLSKNHSN